MLLQSEKYVTEIVQQRGLHRAITIDCTHTDTHSCTHRKHSCSRISAVNKGLSIGRRQKKKKLGKNESRRRVQLNGNVASMNTN